MRTLTQLCTRGFSLVSGATEIRGTPIEKLKTRLMVLTAVLSFSKTDGICTRGQIAESFSKMLNQVEREVHTSMPASIWQSSFALAKHTSMIPKEERQRLLDVLSGSFSDTCVTTWPLESCVSVVSSIALSRAECSDVVGVCLAVMQANVHSLDLEAAVKAVEAVSMIPAHHRSKCFQVLLERATFLLSQNRSHRSSFGPMSSRLSKALSNVPFEVVPATVTEFLTHELSTDDTTSEAATLFFKKTPASNRTAFLKQWLPRLEGRLDKANMVLLTHALSLIGKESLSRPVGSITVFLDLIQREVIRRCRIQSEDHTPADVSAVLITIAQDVPSIHRSMECVDVLVSHLVGVMNTARWDVFLRGAVALDAVASAGESFAKRIPFGRLSERLAELVTSADGTALFDMREEIFTLVRSAHWRGEQLVGLMKESVNSQSRGLSMEMRVEWLEDVLRRMNHTRELDQHQPELELVDILAKDNPHVATSVSLKRVLVELPPRTRTQLPASLKATTMSAEGNILAKMHAIVELHRAVEVFMLNTSDMQLEEQLMDAFAKCSAVVDAPHVAACIECFCKWLVVQSGAEGLEKFFVVCSETTWVSHVPLPMLWLLLERVRLMRTVTQPAIEDICLQRLSTALCQPNTTVEMLIETLAVLERLFRDSGGHPLQPEKRTAEYNAVVSSIVSRICQKKDSLPRLQADLVITLLTFMDQSIPRMLTSAR